MSAFERGKHGNQSIYVPTQKGRPVQRSTGTNDPRVVRGMKRMVQKFKDEHRWLLLDRIEANKLTLREAFTYDVANRLAELEARLSSVNLSDHLAAWIGWVRAARDSEARTADVYWQQVTTLVPDGGEFNGADLTKARVIAWLAGRDKASSGTRRKYLYALKSFVRYLLDVGILATDPLAGLKAPKKDPARKRWVTANVDERIVGAALPHYRALFAFIKATGCDVGSAMRAQRGDVILSAAVVDVRGTKTNRRRVHQATIEAWAVPYLREHCKGVLGHHTPLFAGLTRSGASHHHERCCVAVGVDDYTLKDSRHSVAVRMRKAGKSFETIAAQLGTSVYQTVTVYSAYTPDAPSVAQREAK